MKIRLYYYITFSVALAVFLVSCGTADAADDQTVKRLNDKEVHELIFSMDVVPFEFFYSKVGVEFKDKSRSNSFKATVKMKVDSAFSGTLSLGPVIGATYLVSKDSVFFTDKIKNCYFKENFAYLSSVFGTEIAFDFFQSLILGLPIGIDPDVKYNVKHTRDFYVLSSYKKKDLKKIEDEEEDPIFIQYYINTVSQQLDRIAVQVPSDTVSIDIAYANRTAYETFMLPELTKIKIVHPRDSVFIDLDFGSVKLNERKEIGINIPESYVKCD